MIYKDEIQSLMRFMGITFLLVGEFYQFTKPIYPSVLYFHNTVFFLTHTKAFRLVTIVWYYPILDVVSLEVCPLWDTLHLVHVMTQSRGSVVERSLLNVEKG